MVWKLLHHIIKISIHAPRKGSDQAPKKWIDPAKISIHAPRKGSDWLAVRRVFDWDDFNPRSP